MNKINFNLFLLLLLFAGSATARMRADSSAYFSSFDHTRIYYEVHGHGYPVILVHGFIVDGESWKKTAVYRLLQQAGFQVITLDMRGNGRSDKPHNAAAYAHDAEAKDIMGLAGHLGLRSYHVVGYSRGSIITARLMVLDRRVKKAVMGGMGTDFTNPEWPRRKMFYRALSGDSVAELQPVLKRIRETGLDQQALACMQKEQPSTPQQTLRKLDLPVLVVCGNQDSDNGKASDLAALFKQGRYVEVPGDHGAAVATNEFASSVVEFFSPH